MKCIKSKNIHLFRIMVWLDMKEWHVAWDNFCNINSIVFLIIVYTLACSNNKILDCILQSY